MQPHLFLFNISLQFEKGWVHGELYSRQALTHPRLLPFNMITKAEREYYMERCAECLRALLYWDYNIELVDHEAKDRANRLFSSTYQNHNNKEYNPRPLDLSNMNLEKDMMALAERMAENAHNIWAKRVSSLMVYK